MRVAGTLLLNAGVLAGFVQIAKSDAFPWHPLWIAILGLDLLIFQKIGALVP